MSISWKIKWHQVVISLLIGFTLGTAYGHWQAHQSFHARWKNGGMRRHMLDRFGKELRLNADQKKQVGVIFDAKHPQMIAFQAEMKPKFEALRNSTQAEIRKILNPDQQKKLDEMNVKMEERWKEREKFFGS